MALTTYSMCARAAGRSMEEASDDRWRIELRSVGSGSGRVSRFRRSPGCSADTVKAALGRGLDRVVAIKISNGKIAAFVFTIRSRDR